MAGDFAVAVCVQQIAYQPECTEQAQIQTADDHLALVLYNTCCYVDKQVNV